MFFQVNTRGKIRVSKRAIKQTTPHIMLSVRVRAPINFSRTQKYPQTKPFINFFAVYIIDPCLISKVLNFSIFSSVSRKTQLQRTRMDSSLHWLCIGPLRLSSASGWNTRRHTTQVQNLQLSHEFSGRWMSTCGDHMWKSRMIPTCDVDMWCMCLIRVKPTHAEPESPHQKPKFWGRGHMHRLGV